MSELEKDQLSEKEKLEKDQAKLEKEQLIEIEEGLACITTKTPDELNLLLNHINSAELPVVQNYRFNDYLIKLLDHESSLVKVETARCLAELSKIEEQRKLLTEMDVIVALMNELCAAQILAPTSLEYLIQVCRALGNIVYQNPGARRILNRLNADVSLCALLDVDEKGTPGGPITVEQATKFLSVRCGLLSNYMVGGDVYTKRCVKNDVLAKMQRYVVEGAQDVVKNEDLLMNVLAPLSILAENVYDLKFDMVLNVTLVRILGSSKNPDIAEMCLDLLHYQADSDDVKTILAKEGLCEIIYKLLEQYNTQATTEEARALMKLACEIVVLILTGDEAMNYLYETSLLKYIEEWLESEDMDLLSTAVLALGNFARKDSHCIYMVEHKVMHKLLAILSKNNGIDDDMRLQHALLSTLRNIVIPKPNKAAVVEAGLVETILPMLQIHEPPVVFKLLGTLRMTVDGQEKLAIELLQNETLIKQLVHWSKSSEFANVTGESLRLMAWLIKHGYIGRKSDSGTTSTEEPATAPKDARSLEAFVRTEGAVECMVNMLTSQHLVMQNEALIALSLLFAVIGSKSKESTVEGEISLNTIFIEYDLGAKMAVFISKSSDTMTKEIVENLQTFVGLLRKSPDLVEHLEQHNIDEAMKTIPILTEYCTL